MKITFLKKPIVCSEEEKIFKVLGKMNKHKVKSLPIVDDKGKLKGVLSSTRVLYDLKNPNEQTKVSSIKYKMASISSEEDEEEALRIMSQTGFESIPVVDKRKVVVGLISDYDILDKFKSTTLFKHTLASDLMTKGAFVFANDSIAKARDLMNKNRLDSLAVYKNDQFFGVAVASKFVNKYLTFPRFKQSGKGERSQNKIKSSSLPAEGLIDKIVEPIEEFESLEVAVNKLLKHNLSSLPVMKAGETVGVLRRADIISYVSNKLKSKDVMVNVSGNVSLDEAKGIMLQVQDKIKSMKHLFKNTKKVDVYVKRALMKKHFVVRVYFDKPRQQFKKEGKNLSKTVYDILDNVESLFRKEKNIKKSRRH